MAPRLKFDLIVVDTKNASPDFDSAAEQISENVLVADVCKEGSLDTHDSTLLAEVLSTYLELSTSKEG
jgi:hypothetical protein